MPMSTPYNKTLVAGLAPACTTLIVALIQAFTGAEIGIEVSGALTTVITAALVFLVPNGQPVGRVIPPTSEDDDDYPIV